LWRLFENATVVMVRKILVMTTREGWKVKDRERDTHTSDFWRKKNPIFWECLPVVMVRKIFVMT